MRHITNYKNKNVLVLGAGLSGLYGSELLMKLGANVTLTDPKPSEKFSKHQLKIMDELLKSKPAQKGCFVLDLGIKQEAVAKNFIDKPRHYEAVKNVNGSYQAKLLNGSYDLLVKSPGIPYTNPIVKACQKKNIPITVEVEIASEVNPGGLINVTGSNGKTTTVMLITRMLNAKYKDVFNRLTDNGKKRTNDMNVGIQLGKVNHSTALDKKVNWSSPENKIVKYLQHPRRHVFTDPVFTLPIAYDAGNIGISASKTAEKMSPVDTMVMEISSFMLASITKLHPHIAVITNIYSNHLDWHKTRANYVHDKMNITKNQNANDYFVMNFNSKEWRDLSKKSKAKVIPYCTNGYTTKGAYEKDGKLYFRGEYVMDAKDIRIHGQYNVENALAAIVVAKINGCSNDDIKRVLTTFSGASNRNQYVTTYHNRIFFNDSKSTDVESTEAAVNSFKHPEILLLGGLDRGYTMKTFKKMIPCLKNHVRAVVTFGQTNQLMAKLAQQAGIKKQNIRVVKTIAQAVKSAYQLSQPNNVILLSPANASWDQYANFEIRGADYVKNIKKLTQK